MSTTASSVVTAGRSGSSLAAAASSKADNNYISTDNFLSVYFDRRHKDLKLLLNLLAETSGLPESFRILTLFDKKFQGLWKPQNLRFEEYETVLPAPNPRESPLRSHSIVVRWNDAPIGHFLANYDSSLSFEYTIDINPAPANALGLKSVLYKKVSVDARYVPDALSIGKSKNAIRSASSVNNVEAIHLLESGNNGDGKRSPLPASYRYSVAFDNIVSQEDEYTVTISTELNGRTVTQTVEKFPMGTPEEERENDVDNDENVVEEKATCKKRVCTLEKGASTTSTASSLKTRKSCDKSDAA